MSKTLCHEMVENALGREMSVKEWDKFRRSIERRAARHRQRDPALGYNDSLAQVAADVARENEWKLVTARRNALLDAMRKHDAVEYLEATWKDDPGQGLKALLVGTQDARAGSRSSIGADGEAMVNQVSGGLIADIAHTEGALDLFSRGEMDDEVAGVLFGLSNGEDLSGFSKMAQDIGNAVRKWQDYTRTVANEAGASIGKVRGYVATTFHDSSRIAKDRDGWLQSAVSNFDLTRMADEMDIDEADVRDALLGIWQDLSDGVHLKLWQPPKSMQFLKRDAGKEVSHERVIHFKDAESWSRYNDSFGAGNLREAVMWGLRRQSLATAMMKGLGPRYQDNFDELTGEVLIRMKKRGDAPAKITQFQKDIKNYRRMYLAQLDGSLDIAANDTLATVAGSIRAIQTMSSLGASTLSSVSDLGVMVLGAKYNGMNSLQAVGKGIANLFTGIPKAERLELQADLGVALSSLSGKLTVGRFTPEDDVRGMLGSLQQKFFTFNLQNRWTDSFREAIAEVMSANLARRIGDSFDALPERLRTTLGLYGLDAAKWDIVRQAEVGEVDGVRFLAPRDLDDLPDSAFHSYLAARELEPTPSRIAETRKEIQRQLRAYFSDQNQYMMLTPDAGTMGLMKQGTQRGTGIGEAVRFMMQFKSFSLAYTTKVIGREIKQGGIVGVSQMLALSVLTGYAAMTLKDAFKQRTPRDPTDWRTFGAAFAQGGGAGLYSDVLFSQVLDRRFKDALVSLAGPTAGDVNSLLDIVARASQGEDAGAATVRMVQANAPFLNVFYTRLLLDYLIFYRIQEWMNPGALARMERRMQEQTGQTYIGSPPSEIIN